MLRKSNPDVLGYQIILPHVTTVFQGDCLLTFGWRRRRKRREPRNRAAANQDTSAVDKCGVRQARENGQGQIIFCGWHAPVEVPTHNDG